MAEERQKDAARYPRGHAEDASLTAEAFGRALAEHYDSILAVPLDHRMVALLEQLERSSAGQPR